MLTFIAVSLLLFYFLLLCSAEFPSALQFIDWTLTIGNKIALFFLSHLSQKIGNTSLLFDNFQFDFSPTLINIVSSFRNKLLLCLMFPASIVFPLPLSWHWRYFSPLFLSAFFFIRCRPIQFEPFWFLCSTQLSFLLREVDRFSLSGLFLA